MQNEYNRNIVNGNNLQKGLNVLYFCNEVLLFFICLVFMVLSFIHPETQRIDSGRHNSLPRSNLEEEKIQTISKNPPPTLPPQPLAGEGVIVKPVAIPTTTVGDISKNIHFPRFFSVASLQHYTNSFSQENLIGKGMLGSVYKAELPNGKVIVSKIHVKTGA